MSSNVGLTTPRGSGTSGYVQRNLSLLKPRSTGAGQPYTLTKDTAPRQRKPDQQILQHDRLRDIEVQILELRDRLEDEEKPDEEIDAQCEELREKLVKDMEAGKGGKGGKGRLKSYQVHEMAEAKERESERLRRALGLKRGEETGEDGEHPMARQERRRVEKFEREMREGAEGATKAAKEGERR